MKSDAGLEMKDMAGSPVPEKMKITITLVSGPSLDNVKEFLDAVDASVSRLKSVGAGGGRTVTALGNVLQLTKNIFDNLSQVSTELTVISRCFLYLPKANSCVLSRYTQSLMHHGPPCPMSTR